MIKCGAEIVVYRVSFFIEFNWLFEFSSTRYIETVATFQNFVVPIIEQYQLELGTKYKFSIATLKWE